MLNLKLSIAKMGSTSTTQTHHVTLSKKKKKKKSPCDIVTLFLFRRIYI